MESLYMQRFEPITSKQAEDKKIKTLFADLCNLTENFLDQDREGILDDILYFLENRNRLIRQIEVECDRLKTKMGENFRPGDLDTEIKTKARQLNLLDQKILSILIEKKQENIKEMAKIADNRNRRRRFVKARIIDICQE